MSNYLPQTEEDRIGLQLRTEIDSFLDSKQPQQQRIYRVNYPFLCLYALIGSMGMF
jgi:hypothetical protein